MRKLATVVVFILLLTPLAWGHSGGTDSRGGHHDRKNGGYHYHHGMGPHQHPGGKCPYQNRNKHDWSKYFAIPFIACVGYSLIRKVRQKHN